ncbi:VCBS repeat-containing protein [Pelagicoccus sp. NFK12]|uniref:VCBS repeat-containing protein n=1 Tax=Pelagicoccus enzymogenes TaxID=2773457 RepID=A0A927F9G9_9BACT|nr:FG-GAP-like repeat-containing protein [Pelagicoccus enzymogenes]MBD5780802.1 VCBS repeat-containing protein [Pelagicoccus enzymogenes]
MSRFRVGICLGALSLGAVALFSQTNNNSVSWRALQAPNEAEGETLFQMIVPEDSGIRFENRYDHPQRWTQLWHQYFLGTFGSGLSLGDVNGDGLPDIFAVGKDSPNALYLNRGDFRFEDVTESAGLAGKAGIGAGSTLLDIDNDGDLDLYVTYTGFANELFINDGAGVFSEEAEQWGLAIDTGSNAPSFADYDRDGDLDLYLQCNFLQRSGIPEGMPDRLFENRDGTFVEVTEQAGISGAGQGHAAIWWDFDEDGWPDIYIANDFEPADKLYRNNKDGTFTDVINEAIVSSPYSAMGADLGDFNNDGRMDFMVSEMATHDYVKHHKTIGSIATKVLYADTDTVSQFMKNMVSLKIGPDQFAEVSYLLGLDATDWTWATRFADLDNDGLLDAYFANGMARAFHDGDIGKRSTQAKTGWQRMAYFKNSPQYDEQNLAYRNLGDFAFEDVSEEWGLDLIGVSFAAAFADFDGDGDLDMVLSNMEDNLTLYRNNATTGSRLLVELEGVDSNRGGVGAKLRLFVGDQVMAREVSLTRGYLSNDEPIVHFGLGKGSEIDRLEIEWPSGATQTVRELQAGRRYFVREQADETPLWGGEEPLFVRSEIGVPEETWSSEDHYQMFPMQLLIPAVEIRDGPELAVSDVNGDGYEDVLLGGATGQGTRLFLNRSGESLEWLELDDFEDDFDSEDKSLRLFDFEGDGDLDLFVASGGIELDPEDDFYEDRLYLNDGAGKFDRASRRTLRSEPYASGATAAIDYDNDGDLDLLVAGGSVKGMYPQYEDNLVWRRDEDGFVVDEDSAFAKAFRRSGNTSELLVVDWDGDGALDLVQAVIWGAPVLWRSEEGQLVRVADAFAEETMRGVWRSAAAGDFDGDGLIDLVFGNYGLNTKYKASEQEPVRLFAPDNQYLVNTYIEAKVRDGRVLPMENREVHDIQFPGLMDKTSENISAFAEMEVEEIFTAELLSKYKAYDMTETRSVVLMQTEAGRFVKRALPRWAQSGVGIDLLAVDVDSDGDLDLVMAHEMHAPKLWAERFLRGHLSLLLNDGSGEFEALLPWKSGLSTHGYPRRLAWSDLDRDGKGELLVSMNEGPLLVFRLR